MSASFFGRPDRALKIVGVTGTNGKTTTTFILKHLLSEPKVPVGLIGTVRYEIGERILPAVAHDAGIARPARAARADEGGRLPRGGDGSFLPRAGAGAGRADRISGRRLHEPDPGPSRLPPDDGELFRGQGAALRESRPRGKSGRRGDQRRRSLRPAADRSCSRAACA